jgi:hypothetical protein
MARWSPKQFHRRGVSADPGLRHNFRSGLEEHTSDEIAARGLEVQFETLKVPYTIPASPHRYTPDFVLPNGIIIETKGLWDAADRAKHNLIRAQWPDLDIRLIFQNPDQKISPTSPTSYGDWCDKFGLRWAGVIKKRGSGIVQIIPPQWFDEPGPPIKPMEVLRNGRPR